MMPTIEEARERTKFLTSVSKALIQAEDAFQSEALLGPLDTSQPAMELETLIFGWAPSASPLPPLVPRSY